jgi:probable HAF family extracellular repeat protein
MTDLGTLGGFSGAEAINAAGQVVGWSDDVLGRQHAFLWEDGTMTDLGTLGGDGSAANELRVVVNQRHQRQLQRRIAVQACCPRHFLGDSTTASTPACTPAKARAERR